MKIVFIVLGLIAVALGVVWLLQGLNVWTGNAMSGHKKWALAGGGLIVVGAAIEFFAFRLKKG